MLAPLRHCASTEPGPEGRGDERPITFSTDLGRLLQQSRDPRAAERRRAARSSVAARSASTEPRPEGRGDLAPLAPCAHFRRASTEPRPEGRGDGRPALAYVAPEWRFNRAATRGPRR